MKLIKEYRCDSITPNDEEILEAIKVARTQNCIVKLHWIFPHSGSYSIEITGDMTFDECKDKLLKVYLI